MERPGKLDIGIVGYGYAGQIHREALRHDERINKIAVVDPDWTQRAKASAEGLNAYEDLNQLLDKRVDVVIVSIPPSCNLETVRKITSHGSRPRAILIEKPLATVLSDAEAIQQSLAKTDIEAMVGLTGHGFHPEFRKAHELIQAGAIGEIKSILENIHLGGPGLPPQYLSNAYGGIVLENGIHTLDHLHYLSGQEGWRVVDAYVGNDQWQGEEPDWGEATLFNDGQVAHVSWLWPRLFEVGLEGYTVTLIGNRGRLKILGFDGIILNSREGKLEEHFHDSSTTFNARHIPGFIAEQKAFFDAIEKRRPQPVSVSYTVDLQRQLDEVKQKASEAK
ncbi:hypothetical protein A3A54_01160 [Candidatus Curtissbacteria bacterium RIFCSPLOWO2_01_FULL_39_62]|uniref:Gfo/Idh/MocA-like oxidoreductase N-terminal domain-containing protein n=1 Tax=Candidatus Curtissbacteria bacterium RIFCSPLOWO2_12_FULL_38_9 TaxID=1797735 RepID=A0A1F5IAM7_9BACT|nr:MAG: hypothetical protein A3E11_02365 [Candidatus Curtissbacteria bacterium RIFCSPHIGHO2_12_FULL_38_37]OGE02374.1 MAG: hypothetical protein A3A54_01160 [Candidatus Curtissbacteria bacterium RIFCSPLOWO2_01_FULL_39_62]OGE13443.1 MAG: hypothetical protein A3G14_05345 [Candidatus Curtissbacteria bacterium RIFCSPLOWO2_12_FULL_38_9]